MKLTDANYSGRHASSTSTPHPSWYVASKPREQWRESQRQTSACSSRGYYSIIPLNYTHWLIDCSCAVGSRAGVGCVLRLTNMLTFHQLNLFYVQSNHCQLQLAACMHAWWWSCSCVRCYTCGHKRCLYVPVRVCVLARLCAWVRVCFCVWLRVTFLQYAVVCRDG